MNGIQNPNDDDSDMCPCNNCDSEFDLKDVDYYAPVCPGCKDW